jgi:hypothetical protein
MTTIKFIYKSLWRAGTVLSESSQHAQYPSENTQDDIKTLVWRSRHGTSSGNGLFVIGTSNHHIDFDEGAAELNAVLTAGSYNGQTLAAEIKIQMDAAGGTYGVTYSESTGKFTIDRTGNFTLRWNTGTNKAASACATLGFVDSADDTGAATYTSDNITVHTAEYIDMDYGSALEDDFIALLNHNLTSAAVITYYGADDAAFTSNVVSDVIAWNALNIYKFLAAARTKRYRRLHVVDPKNPSCYIQIGTIVTGKAFAPNRNFIAPYSKGLIDETETETPPSGNLFVTLRRSKKNNWGLQFNGLTEASIASIAAMIDCCGVSEALMFCTDTAAPNGNTHWARLKETEQQEMQAINHWSWTATLEEVL